MKIEEKALTIYKPPFNFQHGYIYDSEGNMFGDEAGKNSIMRVRGWGRIGGMEDGERIQDAVGEHVALALTEYWNNKVEQGVM